MSRRNTSDIGFVIMVVIVTIALFIMYAVYHDKPPSQSTNEEPISQSISKATPRLYHDIQDRIDQSQKVSRSQDRDPLEAALRFHEHAKTYPTLIPPPPTPTPTPTPTQESTEVVTTTDDGLNWEALAACESGGNPTIVSSNGLWYGLYQFTIGTWQGVGGTGLPTEASPAEQTARAQLLYKRAGDGPWPNCGYHLYD